jgi:hypothetical protein
MDGQKRQLCCCIQEALNKAIRRENGLEWKKRSQRDKNRLKCQKTYKRIQKGKCSDYYTDQVQTVEMEVES